MRPLLLLALVGCATATDAPRDTDLPDAPDTVEVTEASFPCLADMRPVRRFLVDNLLGDLDATLAVAEDPLGKTWPVGTLIQLVPIEAMVKREAGFSPKTADWEFFALEVDDAGTTIAARGTTDVINAFGGNCYDCHVAARAADYVCEQDNGCVPLPLTEDVIRGVQERDPRCGG